MVGGWAKVLNAFTEKLVFDIGLPPRIGVSLLAEEIAYRRHTEALEDTEDCPLVWLEGGLQK